MTYHVQWSQIEAECGGFRQGFVATFRKYEGMATDEKDGQGRTVKVTMATFARHVGINEETFRRWVRAEQDPQRVAPARRPQDLKRDVLRAARHEPEAVVEGILDAPEEVQDEIYHELKLRRATEDRSPANRKAAEAHAHAAIEPIRRAIASTHIALCVQALNEAADELNEALEEGAVTPEGLEAIDKAHDLYVMKRHEAEFKVDV